MLYQLCSVQHLPYKNKYYFCIEGMLRISNGSQFVDLVYIFDWILSSHENTEGSSRPVWLDLVMLDSFLPCQKNFQIASDCLDRILMIVLYSYFFLTGVLSVFFVPAYFNTYLFEYFRVKRLQK